MIHPFFLYFQESLAVKTLLVTLDHLLDHHTACAVRLSFFIIDCSFLFVIFPTPCALRLRLMGFAVILYEQLFLLLSEMFWFKTIFIQTSIFLKSVFLQKSMKTWILRY